MNYKQPYLKFIEENSPVSLGLKFVLFYLLTATGFAALYALVPLSTSETGLFERALHHLYFSVVTQSTLGYGNIVPTNSIGKIIVIIQVIFGVVSFAVGTGIVIIRLLTPDVNSITFDDYLVFNPDRKKFVLRFVNRLPVTKYNGLISMRLRRQRQDRNNKPKIVRKNINMQAPNIAYAEPLIPYLSSTAEIKSQTDIESVEIGVQIELEPSHISKNDSVEAIFTSQIFIGVSVTRKTFEAENIICGSLVSTYVDPTKISWSNWGDVNKSRPERCVECEFKDGCYMRESL